MMSKITLILGTYFLVACNTQQACTILPGHPFSGDGVLIVPRGVATDGMFTVTFFPICKIDKSHIISSLERAQPGIIFSMNYNLIKSSLKEKSIKLTDNDTTLSAGLRTIYATPVHISFEDTLASYEKDHSKKYRYVLDTREIKFENKVRTTSSLQIKDLSPL